MLAICATFCIPAHAGPVYLRYSSQYDANELYLATSPTSMTLLVQDLVPWREAPGPDYDAEYVFDIDPAGAPYFFAYKQERLQFSGTPVYFDALLGTESFQVGVNNLPGYLLLRETMFIFDHSSVPFERWQQLYLGPDNELYAYHPNGTPGFGRNVVPCEDLGSFYQETYRSCDAAAFDPGGDPNPVSEPGSIALCVAVLAAMGLVHRRRTFGAGRAALRT